MDFDWNSLFADLPPLEEPVRFSVSDRAAHLNELRHRRFDVLILGGGFNGCAVAAELAEQGLKVGLVEESDFCSRTSMSSGIILWGGIKYLANLDFGLVRNSCIERNRFLRRAPHIVREREFFSPVYRGDPYGFWLRWIGTWIHFLLGGGWWGTREPRLYHGPPAALDKDPRLRPENLLGGVSYWDAELETSDAHLGLSLGLTAAARGAVLVNYCELLGFLFDGDRISAARCRDRINGQELSIEAEVFVNACGPWAEKVNAMAVWNDPTHQLVLRRGTFLVTEPQLFDTGEAAASPPGHALNIFSISDRRPMFFYPWGPRFLAGTTDVPTDAESLASIETSADEFSYLQREIPQRLRLREPLIPRSIIENRVGVRPLAVRKSRASQASGKDALSLSRRHALAIHRGRRMITILGGKLTPARRLAEEIGRTLLHHWPHLFRGRPYRSTAETSVYGAERLRTLDEMRHRAREHARGGQLDDEVLESLVAQWGEHAGEPLALIQRHPQLAGRVYTDLPYTWADLVHNLRNRMVFSLDDLLRRRTNIAQWIPRGGLGTRGEHREIIENIARLICAGNRSLEKEPEHLVADYELLVEERNRWRERATEENAENNNAERTAAL